MARRWWSRTSMSCRGWVRNARTPPPGLSYLFRSLWSVTCNIWYVICDRWSVISQVSLGQVSISANADEPVLGETNGVVGQTVESTEEKASSINYWLFILALVLLLLLWCCCLGWVSNMSICLYCHFPLRSVAFFFFFFSKENEKVW